MSTPMPERILFVDDERNVLDALSRHLRKGYTVVTACGAEEGLQAIASTGPFAVVVSDYTMPGMNGIQFLGLVAERSPNAVRIMLTGNADVQVAIEAVNRGRIFRLLTKPCEPALLVAALDAALEQYRLKQGEKVLLEQTLRGSIRVMAEILSLVKPAAFGRALRLQSYVRQLVGALKLEGAWLYETAALLSQLGLVVLPSELLDKHVEGRKLAPDEQRLFDSHPAFTRDLLAHIPRLEVIAEIILRQNVAPGARELVAVPPVIALGGQILRAALLFDDLIARGEDKEKALELLQERGLVEPSMLVALGELEPAGQHTLVRTIPVRQLRVGMVLDEDLMRPDGQLIIARGQEITPSLLERLRNYVKLGQTAPTVRMRSAADPPGLELRPVPAGGSTK